MTLSEYENLKKLFIETFHLPNDVNIFIEEKYTISNDSKLMTEVIIKTNSNNIFDYSFDKKASEITKDDILQLKESLKKLAYKNHPILARMSRLFGWWLIFASSITMFSVCPHCGQVGCPIGIGTTGILAGFLAFFKMYLKDIIFAIKLQLSSFYKNIF